MMVEKMLRRREERENEDFPKRESEDKEIYVLGENNLKTESL